MAAFVALTASVPASGVEFDLPGERRMQINGFYELRLRLFGEDLPANGASLSQFRHVLQVETVTELLPDGVGALGLGPVIAFTRWVGSYECVYERACGLFPAADSYGERSVRYPRSFKTPRTDPYYAGGLFGLPYFPGTTVSTRQRITPGDRYTDCLNADGVFTNPNPLALLCNLFPRTQVDAFGNNALAPETVLEVGGVPKASFAGRSGAVEARYAGETLALARSRLGEAEFARLRSLPRVLTRVQGTNCDLPAGTPPPPGCITRTSENGAAFGRAAGLPAALRAAALRGGNGRAGFLPGGMRDTGESAAALTARADALLAGTLEAELPTLLQTLPGVDRFGTGTRGAAAPAGLAVQNGTSLGTQTWGADAYRDVNAPWLATLDAQIRPFGYLTGESFDWIPEFSPAFARDFRSTVGGNEIGASARRDNFMIPAFLGPDGVEFTADDLPLCLDAGCSGQRVTDRDGKAHEIFRILRADGSEATGPDDPAAARGVSCRALTAGQDLATDARRVGVNAEGLCVQMLFGGGSVTEAGADALLAGFVDRSRRPDSAPLDPANLTDADLVRRGYHSIPARPANPDGGLYYRTAGVARLQRSSHHLVSNLDLDFRESELRWEHGGSQDEHEFREGYLELDAFDSDLFVRIGKLVMVWGKTELFRNQDRLNPVDGGIGTLARLEDARVAQWAGQFVYSPEWGMQVGALSDLRFELAVVFDDFEPVDLGVCGESLTFSLVCAKSFGAIAAGLTGAGLVGEIRPDEEYSGLRRLDWGFRIEGRFDRFTFALTDFWGWDDAPYVETVQEFDRRVDTVTGAPTNAFGPVTCRWRGADGGSTSDLEASVGPDGVDDGPGVAGDDGVPSIGNCLLFDDPSAPGAPQVVRASADIALNHPSNQTLYHTICTLTFDEDTGRCPFDQLNAPEIFPLGATVLIGGLQNPALLPDFTSLKTRLRPFRGLKLTDEILVNVTGSPASSIPPISSVLTPQQAALLGCGLAWASPCDQAGPDSPENNAALKRTYGVALVDPNDPTSPLLGPTAGGIDLLNADASVLTQEFTILKAFSGSTVRADGSTVEGALVGSTLDATDPARRRAVGVREFSFLPGVCLDPAQPGCQSGNTGGTDFQIEGMRWLPDPELLTEGVVVFQADPDDPLDTSSPLNVFNPRGENCSAFNSSMIDPGCTSMELLSANFERVLIAADMAGSDDLFDPPETLAELRAMLDGDATNDAFGDPIAGPDGIFFSNFDARTSEGDLMFYDANTGRPRAYVDPAKSLPVRVFDISDRDLDQDGERDDEFFGFPVPNAVPAVVTPIVALDADGADPAGRRVVDRSVDELAIQLTADGATQRGLPRVRGYGEEIPASSPNGCPDPSAFLDRDLYCFHDLARAGIDGLTPTVVGAPPAGPLIAALPIRAHVEVDGGAGFQDAYVDPRWFAPSELMSLVNGQPVELDGERLNLPSGQVTVRDHATLSKNLRGMLELDNDGDKKLDLDQNGDGVFDFIDDGTAGPISDDNILCGSGIPGDPLQEALQFEFVDGTLVNGIANGRGSSTQFNTLVGTDGSTLRLQPRSPVGCAGALQTLSVTGQSLPFLRAGGNGTFGRREFSWHGGRQLVLRYQKRNVLGFALDFAEDTTKSSWGIEFSYTNGRLFGDTLSIDGLHRSDEYQLTVSVDRPTFVRFLNPNRTFFVNAQFFLRYLSDYHGGRDDHDGMFASVLGPFDGFMTLSVFTGYFQDRLEPRFTAVWFPTSSTAAMLTGLSYRWTQNFTTALGLNHFFGHPTQGRAPYYGFQQFDPDITGEVFHGTAAARNRDAAVFTFRYSF